jgi:hypothetical protein
LSPVFESRRAANATRSSSSAERVLPYTEHDDENEVDECHAVTQRQEEAVEQVAAGELEVDWHLALFANNFHFALRAGACSRRQTLPIESSQSISFFTF